MNMIKFFVPFALALGVPVTGFAQSYGGLGVGYSRIGASCGASIECSSKRFGGVVFVGAELPEHAQAEFMGVKLTSVEVGAASFGTKSATTETITTVRNGVRLITTRTENKYFMSGNGMFAAAVMRMPIVADDLSLVGRVGMSYVSSTVGQRTNGVSVGSETSNRFAPYLGLGVDYKLVDGLSIAARLDATKFGASGRGGSLLLGSIGVVYQY